MQTPEALLSITESIDEKKKEKIVFVCTGNTCRSPMAAALFNHLCKASKYHAESAGLICSSGDPISENAKEALMRRGVLPTPDNDYTRHLSRRISEDIIKDASIVVGISAAHTMNLIARFPMYTSRITFLPMSISDPYGGSIEVYEGCLADIEDALKDMLEADGGIDE